jgi:hypothetical protein
MGNCAHGLGITALAPEHNLQPRYYSIGSLDIEGRHAALFISPNERAACAQS